jgi:hypothetical protein
LKKKTKKKNWKSGSLSVFENIFTLKKIFFKCFLYIDWYISSVALKTQKKYEKN